MPEPRSGRRRYPSRRAVLTSAAAGLGAALVPGLSACSAGAGTSGPITLTFSWWGNDDRAARTRRAVRLFEEENPGIRVRTSNGDFNSYLQKLATQAAGGGIPDVAQLDYRQVSPYAGGGALRPLEPYLGDGALRTSEMDEELVRTGTFGGTQYAVPMGRGITGYAYDSAIYEKAGIPTPQPDWTWQEWADVNRTIADLGLKSPTGRPVTGANDGGTNEDVFEVWLRSRGGQLYADQNRLGFTEDDLTAFWTYFNDLRKEGAVAAAGDTVQASSAETSPLGRGLAAADFNWDATFPGHVELSGDHIHFAPAPTTGGRAGTYFKPTMLLGIGGQSEHPAEAAALVDFLLNDPRAGDILGFTRSTPPNRAIAAAVAETLDGPELEIYRYGEEMADYGLAPPPLAPPSGDIAVKSAFNRLYQRVIFRLATPRQAARELIDEAERELRSWGQ